MAIETPFKVNLTDAEAGGIVEMMQMTGTDLRAFGSRTDAERLAMGIVCLRRHVKGETQVSIGEDLGVPQPTVHRYIQRALATIALPSVVEARAQMLAAVDRQIAVWGPRSEAGDEKAAAALARFTEQRAKLTGAYAPIQVEAQVHEVTVAEQELQQLLREAQAKEALKEASIMDVSDV